MTISDLGIPQQLEATNAGNGNDSNGLYVNHFYNTDLGQYYKLFYISLGPSMAGMWPLPLGDSAPTCDTFSTFLLADICEKFLRLLKKTNSC